MVQEHLCLTLLAAADTVAVADPSGELPAGLEAFHRGLVTAEFNLDEPKVEQLLCRLLVVVLEHFVECLLAQPCGLGEVTFVQETEAVAAEGGKLLGSVAGALGRRPGRLVVVAGLPRLAEEVVAAAEVGQGHSLVPAVVLLLGQPKGLLVAADRPLVIAEPPVGPSPHDEEGDSQQRMRQLLLERFEQLQHPFGLTQSEQELPDPDE